MLFSVFNVLGPISNPTPPTAALSFSMRIQWRATIHCQFRDIWYLRCACICVLVCILCHSYVLRPMWLALVVVLFYLRFLRQMWLFVVFACILVVLIVWALQLIFRTLRPGLQPQQDASLFYPREERCGLCMWFECGSWLSFDGCFILFYRSHSYRGAAVVPRSNYRSWA